jgi:hypothetical protein
MTSKYRQIHIKRVVRGYLFGGWDVTVSTESVTGVENSGDKRRFS